jgi:hypothetical protein
MNQNKEVFSSVWRRLSLFEHTLMPPLFPKLLASYFLL